ncbi:Molybdopterin molybdenumtransferase, partial [Haemophilus influenzae]
LLVN